jgi:NAD(P)-dependent dehydrogenase (short-subunit alcohol dehydrogenase family)
MKVDLSGKIALVTGAAGGIGLAIADAFAGNGAQVVYTDIDVPVLKKEAAKFASARGYEMDVRREDQVREVVKQVMAEFGRIDILVNNAGINTVEHRVTFDEFPAAEWDRVMETDLNGVVICSRVVSPLMVAQKAGRIIHISSIAGLVALRLQSSYVAAKHAIVGLTRAMAIELAPKGVLVNAIAPGSTISSGTRKLFYGVDGRYVDRMQRIIDHIPLGRPAEAAEIAHGALFLAAPESAYITGTVLTIDGGWTAGGYCRDF